MLLGAGFAGVLAMWWSATSPGAGASPVEAATAASELAGVMAGYLVCVQLLLTARIPWLESAVGLDRLVGWHRVIGPSTVFLVAVHVVLIVAATGAPAGAGPLGSVVLTVQSYPDILAAVAGTAALFALGASCARWARSRMSYEAWYWLHLTSYAAVFLAFLHQLSAGPTFLGSPVYRALWLLLYLGTASAVVTWRVVLTGWAAWRHRMRVEAVVAEGEGTVSVWLRGRNLHDRNIRPGQFLSFRFLAWGHLLSAHPYSVSRAPADGCLRITVSAAGGHSQALSRLRSGTLVVAEGPYGHFTADLATRGRALLVAGGAGIGPICALAKDLAARGADVVVLYRARTASRLALAHELDRVPGIRLATSVGSRREIGFDPLAARSIADAVPDAAGRDAFICGPPGMADTARASLRRLGVPARRIHTDEMSMS